MGHHDNTSLGFSIVLIFGIFFLVIFLAVRAGVRSGNKRRDTDKLD